LGTAIDDRDPTEAVQSMLRRLKPEPEQRQPLLVLRRSDQALLGGVALAAILGLTALWYLRGGAHGNLVEYDHLSADKTRFQIDINQASWPELCELPRVGETLAQRIVEHREKHGPFRRPEDLMQVRGIGVKTLENIRPYLAPMPGEKSAGQL
jgi:competence ComEA-like helix-hairpin-helix protein